VSRRGRADRHRRDLLIVAVNTDESLRPIKPDRWPANPDLERMGILAAPESVAYVVPLADRTPAGQGECGNNPFERKPKTDLRFASSVTWMHQKKAGIVLDSADWR
jgi:hypothetical protein